jgi:hypothetical protein
MPLISESPLRDKFGLLGGKNPPDQSDGEVALNELLDPFERAKN